MEIFIFANMQRKAVGTRQLLIKRERGFILQEGWGVKAFVPCRLTTHTLAVSAKE